ncbi:restriction endonuclease subunit S, partial [Lactiplantibacillus plantarum]
SKRGAAILTNKVRILEKKMFMDTNMMALTPVETDLYFLYFLISEENLSKIADTSTIPQINNKHIIPYTIYLPCLMEQQRLGKVLILLSNLIAANEDKLEQLKTLKKLMMQKIFSQEWRFKGFTDPWEQRKLKWFLRVSKLKNIDGIFDKNSVLSVSGEFGVVNQIAFQGRSFAGKSILNYGILDHNDVVYTKSPLKSNPYGIIKTNLGKAGVVSTLYAVYAPLKTVYSPILGYYFNLDTRVNNYLRPLVNKGAKNDMKVRDEAVLEGKVCIPDSIETQKRICNLFSLIDNLIAANEDKLNQLKELKKYLMQNMFV